MTRRILSLILLSVVLLLGCFASDDPEVDLKLSWPIEIESEKGIITTLYQPQLESFQNNDLEGRMAVTIKVPEEEMIFGALWFRARLETDLDNRTVLLEKMEIIKTHFPNIVEDEKISNFSELLSAEIESWNLEMSLDRILASLDEVENLKELSDQINNDPPEIYFRNTPAILMTIDGDPILSKDEGSGLEYVVNTPFFIVKDPKKDNYYISGGPFWYKSTEILQGWEETSKVPSKIKKLAEESIEDPELDSISQSYTEAPELIMVTKPAELILVDGETDYQAIEGTSLLYVANSESDIIMDINSQSHYVLLAGRWYYSKTLQDGDWTFREPNELPEDFSKIPENSDMVSVRASIPGTDEAQTALLEQSIPQTATIDRKEASVEVKYDGDPQFEKIEGTEMSYAVNTDKSVLLIEGAYYCIDDAVWFISDKPTGPWEVCVERPDEVDDLPPESPVYNVKYTYIYESTPEVVYVGYLPGYTHCYVYNGVVVYGTGYYYNPWYVSVYYPRPVTWGFGVHYNPWTGWGFSVGFSYGWCSWGFHPYGRAYWGPRGYHSGYRHGYHHGYHRGYGHGYRAGYAAGQRNSNRNVYNNRSSGVNQSSARRNPQASNSINNRARPSNQPNNMYTDKSGNVYQRNQNGNYENRSNKQGQQGQAQNSQRQSTGRQPSTSQKPSTSQQPSAGQQPRSQQGQVQNNQRQQLDKSHQNRSQGTQNYNRSQQYQQQNRSRSSSPSGGRSGGAGGGGGRRR
jgi:hypothetical protein